jgi:hypothetical protein
MLSFNDVNILGSIIDTTFGYSSTQAGSSSIKIQLVGETMVFTYHEICNMVQDREKLDQLRSLLERGNNLIKERRKQVEKEFKKVTKKDLKLKEHAVQNTLDPMGYNYLSPVRPTHFRMTATFQVG